MTCGNTEALIELINDVGFSGFASLSKYEARAFAEKIPYGYCFNSYVEKLESDATESRKKSKARDKIKKIEALVSGGSTEGERQSAKNALEKVKYKKGKQND